MSASTVSVSSAHHRGITSLKLQHCAHAHVFKPQVIQCVRRRACSQHSAALPDLRMCLCVLCNRGPAEAGCA